MLLTTSTAAVHVIPPPPHPDPLEALRTQTLTHMGGPDTIRIDALSIHLLGAGPSAFGLTPPPACPLELSLDLELHPSVVPHSVEEDAMAGLGVNYSSVAKAVYAALDRVAFSSPAAILDAAAAVPLSLPAVQNVGISARLPRALLHADTVYARTYTNTSRIPRSTTVPVARRSVLSLTTANICAATVVGLHPHEREKKQRLEVDVTVRGAEDDSHHTLSDTALDVRYRFGIYKPKLTPSFSRQPRLERSSRSPTHLHGTCSSACHQLRASSSRCANHLLYRSPYP